MKKFLLMIDCGADGWTLVKDSDDFEELRKLAANDFYESWSNGSLIIVTTYLMCNTESAKNEK